MNRKPLWRTLTFFDAFVETKRNTHARSLRAFVFVLVGPRQSLDLILPPLVKSVEVFNSSQFA
jgi:hypothetical protein